MEFINEIIISPLFSSRSLHLHRVSRSLKIWKMVCKDAVLYKQILALSDYTHVKGHAFIKNTNSRNFQTNSPSSEGFLSARRADEMDPKAEKARRLLVSCWLKNSSSLPTSLIKSGVVEREIITWNWSHPSAPFTKRLAVLEGGEWVVK